MAANKVMICAGVITLIQAVGQVVFCSLGLAQYFCVVDFLRELPMLLYIRIMYFHKPGPCGTSINIGNAIEGIANQAFVLITSEPLPASRTFIINCTNLGIAGLWIPASILIIMGGAKNTQSKCVRWPWVLTTVAASGVDVVAVVMYANDSFYTRTLSEIMDFVGGTVSGIGSANLDTTWASWIMVIIYSRFVFLFVINVLLILSVIVDCNAPIRPINTGTQVEAPVTRTQDTSTSDKEEDEESTTGDTRPLTLLPRPGLSRSFRRMKTFLFGRLMSAPVDRSNSNVGSYNASVDRSPKPQNAEKRSVNFPENLLSLPQRLENMIAEQQRRLDQVIDTAGRSDVIAGNSPPRATQSMPQLPLSESDQQVHGPPSSFQLKFACPAPPRSGDVAVTSAASLSRRGTAAELGQRPWAYIPAPATRMQDEELPPVPLPDYTAIQSNRKASVHRAASSLSSLVQHRRDLAMSQSRPTITESDVLY